ncbi:MAG: CopG family ribbon-helix-helix protein [Candidatus Aenigmatarchaeota archaeon]
MAEIISLSLTPELKKELDRLQNEYGFSGRSEVIRSGIRMLLSENKDMGKMTGKIDATLLITHHEKYTKDVFAVMHQYTHLVKSQIHYHIHHDKCLEMFILNGEGKEIEMIVRGLRKQKEIEFIKLVML